MTWLPCTPPRLTNLCQALKRLILSHNVGGGVGMAATAGPLPSLFSESSYVERLLGILLLQVLNLLNY